ncbi:hypothetical protein EBMC1_08296 [Sphingopyxis sp. MC1]|nr:hypothetical protein [Sphingopyxis sp. MC1]ENY81508.1 hypothetical protein EBMC1_08296 [Sphingopyxis sp. MC1]
MQGAAVAFQLAPRFDLADRRQHVGGFDLADRQSPDRSVEPSQQGFGANNGRLCPTLLAIALPLGTIFRSDGCEGVVDRQLRPDLLSLLFARRISAQRNLRTGRIASACGPRSD